MVDDKAQLNPFQTPGQPTEPLVRRKPCEVFREVSAMECVVHSRSSATRDLRHQVEL